MSRPRGGFIGANVTPASAAVNSAASGVWTVREAEALKRAGTWPSVLPQLPFTTGLQLHLDAADASTLFDATSGGSLVAADGGVARWEDKSGNGRHVTQGTAGNRPARKTSQQNGFDALLFDGVNDVLSFSNAITIPASYTAFQVFRRQNSGISSGLLGASTGTVGYAFFWYSDNLVYERSNSGGDGYTLHGTANTSTGYFVVVTTRNGTTSVATRRNGSAIATVTSGANVTNGANLTWAGIGRLDSVTFHQGNACEIIVYNSALSDANRAAVENYLISKWGIV